MKDDTKATLKKILINILYVFLAAVYFVLGIGFVTNLTAIMPYVAHY